jgi:hypothetical protein
MNGVSQRISRFPSIGVVGGGIGGVAAAVMLPRAGYPDVTVFERNARVGGVWNDNTYPGAACDAPSHLYEFSFAPYPRWSRRYAPQAEIQAYLEASSAASAPRAASARTPRCNARAGTRTGPSGCGGHGCGASTGAARRAWSRTPTRWRPAPRPDPNYPPPTGMAGRTRVWPPSAMCGARPAISTAASSDSASITR